MCKLNIFITAICFLFLIQVDHIDTNAKQK